ncbi:hypothetical protein AB2H60_24720 (plasmid) [Escherichia coli]
MAGINWPACSDNIQLNPRGVERYSSYNKTSPRSFEKSLKGRVEIYSVLNTAKGLITRSLTSSIKAAMLAHGAVSPSCFLNIAVSKSPE